MNTIMRATLALGPVLALALGVAPTVSAATTTAAIRQTASARITGSTVHRLGTCRARGDFATCEASGSINHPLSLHVHVKGNPRQGITGNWTMVCSEGSGAGSRSGNFRGTTPLVRTMRMPESHPSSCTVSALGSLDGNGGWIRVWITART